MFNNFYFQRFHIQLMQGIEETGLGMVKACPDDGDQTEITNAGPGMVAA